MNIINIQLGRNTSHVAPLLSTSTFLSLPFLIHQVLQTFHSFRKNLLLLSIELVSSFVFLVLSVQCDAGIFFADTANFVMLVCSVRDGCDGDGQLLSQLEVILFSGNQGREQSAPAHTVTKLRESFFYNL